MEMKNNLKKENMPKESWLDSCYQSLLTVPPLPVEQILTIKNSITVGISKLRNDNDKRFVGHIQKAGDDS
jgi:hypothetical protein